MCICVPNIKFLCITLCQGEVCTDNANADTNNDGQRTTVKGSLADKPNEPKMTDFHRCVSNILSTFLFPIFTNFHGKQIALK